VASDQQTVIVGAGIAGLACARRLHDAGRSFLLISENVGGRVQRSEDQAINLGAHYVRADYTHVNAFVRLGRRIDKLSTQRHVEDDSYNLWDRRLLLHLPQGVRFLRLLHVFRRRYETLKEHCLTWSQAEAIRSDPLLARLYCQPASAFVAEHELRDVARWYLAPGMHGTTFCRLDHITAFTLLLGAMPLIVPIYEFTLDVEALAGSFRRAIIEDSVIAVASTGAEYEVRTRGHGHLTATRVVIATPPGISRQLLALPTIKLPVAAHIFHVSGVLRRRYSRADINLFPETDATLAIARQADGSILFCSAVSSPDFGRYLASWRVVEHREWAPAFNIVGDSLLECELAPGLYLIGDHNICGLEDSYLTGLYAADQIIADTKRGGARAGLAEMDRGKQPGVSPRLPVAADVMG
jgi:glycine/D-amino acid oxidase-like deaminating enzyme